MILVEVTRKLRRVMTRSSRPLTGLIYLRGLNEVVRTVIGQKLTARYSVPENPERLVYAYQSAGRSTKARMLGVVCLSVMSRCSDSNLPQDKALGTFARNRHSCHRSTHVDRGWSMTLNFMPLVILFGLALLLVGRTNDQQTQQTAMNISICVLAIRSGFSNRRSGLQTNQLCATGFRGGRRPQYEIVDGPLGV